MAKKKPRTPPPPRPVQAPKVRQAQGQGKGPRDPRRTRLIFLGLIVGIVAIALAAGLGIALGGGGGAEITAGGCTTESLPEQGREHAEELPDGYEYNSFPATSGTHNAVPAIYGFYEDEPVDEFLLVHNLEHGAVVVHVGEDVPQETVDQIRTWYENDEEGAAGLIVTPRPGLGDKVAVTAWTQLLICPGFVEEAFDEFTAAYRYQGPERFAPDAMRPGTN